MKASNKVKHVSTFTFCLLIKPEEDYYIAHCLELDIIATGNTPQRAMADVVDLIGAQIDYAFSHDNLDNLYHPAPPEVWQEFLSCKRVKAKKAYPIKPAFPSRPKRLVPESFETTYCSDMLCVN